MIFVCVSCFRGRGKQISLLNCFCSALLLTSRSSFPNCNAESENLIFFRSKKSWIFRNWKCKKLSTCFFLQMLSFAVLIFWNFVLSFQHSARFARRMRRFSTVWRDAILQQPHVYLGWDDGNTDVAADIDWIKLWKIRTKKIHIIVVYKMKGTRSRNNIGRRVKL